MSLGVKVFDEDGNLVRDDLGRTILPREVRPGAEITVEVTIPLPLAEGRYRMKYDAVVEGHFWFEALGSRAAERQLRVRA